MNVTSQDWLVTHFEFGVTKSNANEMPTDH